MTELQHNRSLTPRCILIASQKPPKGEGAAIAGKKMEQDFSNNLFWLDYGARQYDPTRGQFTTPDPLAEKYYGWNYYTYCVNNPMKYIDPDGRANHVAVVTIGVGLGCSFFEGYYKYMGQGTLKEIIGASLKGFCEGAAIGFSLATRLDLKKTAALSGAASSLGSTLEQLVVNGNIDAEETAKSGGSGLLAGICSYGVSKVIDKIASTKIEKIASTLESPTNSETVKKEIQKELKVFGTTTTGKSGKEYVNKTVKEKIASKLSSKKSEVKFQAGVADYFQQRMSGKGINWITHGIFNEDN